MHSPSGIRRAGRFPEQVSGARIQFSAAELTIRRSCSLSGGHFSLFGGEQVVASVPMTADEKKRNGADRDASTVFVGRPERVRCGWIRQKKAGTPGGMPAVVNPVLENPIYDLRSSNFVPILWRTGTL